MSTLDFVALSFLPVAHRRHLGDELRAGADPARLLARLSDQVDSEEGPHTLPGLRARAASALARAADLGIDAISWTDPAYPPLLGTIFDPPPVLWAQGSSSALGPPAVAIVGSRAGSPYAVAVAERLAGDLASRGVVIVSGLARGVDSAAHRGALAAGGQTVAILGSGVDVVYPPEHGTLADEILSAGAVLSELAPGTPPRKPFFPLRNRIISGLSRAVVVVEAGERSGSLITARAALEQGRDVLAVPGNVLNGRNRGGHALLKDGAKIVESADDIFEELGLGFGNGLDGVVQTQASPPEPLADPLLAGWSRGETRDVDEMAGFSGLPLFRLLPRLLELELRGVVRRAGGGRFMRI